MVRRLRLTHALSSVLTIDLRSLAAFRIGLALLLLGDLLRRSRDLVAHYSDLGILPRSLLHPNYGAPYDLSLYMLSGSPWWTGALFILAGAVALALLVGWRTWWATLLSWVLLASLHNRSPILEHGADVLLRMMLFWSLFLPLGAYWSVDAARRRRAGLAQPQSVFSIGSAALLLQIITVYWCTVLIKIGAEWHAEGSASLFILSADQFSTPFGITAAHYLREHQEIMRFCTWLAFYTEVFAPWLLLAPWQLPRTRMLGVLALATFHIGLILCMDLGLFAWTDLVSLLLFLPPGFWPLVGSQGGADDAPFKSWRIGRPGLDRSARLLCGACLALMLLWNLSTLPGSRFVMPKPLFVASRLLRLDQNWQMFAPSPIGFGGWVVAAGQLAGGRSVELFGKEGAPPLSWARPPDVAATYRNDRWRLLLIEMMNEQHRGYATLMADYLCRDWPRRYPEAVPLLSVELVSMRTPTLIHQTQPYLAPVSVLNYPCPVR